MLTNGEYWEPQHADYYNQQYSQPQPPASYSLKDYIADAEGQYGEDEAQRMLNEKLQEAEFRTAYADSQLIQLRQFQAKEVAFQWKARAQISDYAQTVDWRVMEAVAAADVAEQRLEAQAEAADQWRAHAEHLEVRLRALEHQMEQNYRLQAWEAREARTSTDKQKNSDDPGKETLGKWKVKTEQPKPVESPVQKPKSPQGVDTLDITDEADNACAAQPSPNSISREQMLKMQFVSAGSKEDTKGLRAMETTCSSPGKDRVKELQAQVETLQKEVKALKGQLKRQKDEAAIVEQLKEELSKLRKEKKTVDQEKAQLETRLTRSEGENKIMRRRLKHFEREGSTSVGSAAGFSTEASIDSDEEVAKTEPSRSRGEEKGEGEKATQDNRGRSAWFFW